MSIPQPVTDPSAKRWLAATVGVVVLCLGSLACYFIDIALRPAGDVPPKTQTPTIVRRAVVESADAPLPPVEFPPLPPTPAEREKTRQEIVHQQAGYLRDLAAKHPKTASLATPEQIAEMEKAGRVAQ